MELVLKTTAGANLADASQRWLAPNAFHTIIKQTSVYVNGTLTTEQTDTYAYKSYIETILNYDTEDEDTILRPQGSYSGLDYPTHVQLVANNIDQTHADYKALPAEKRKAIDGLLKMRGRTTGGKTIILYGMLHVDLFNTGRMLIQGVDLKIRLNGITAVNTDVRLKAGDLNMKFYACMVKVRSDVYNHIASARLHRNLDVYYPTVRSEIRTYTLQNLHSTFEATNMFNGRVPDRVFVGIVYQDAFSGKYGYNPFIFKKDKITSIKQVVEGEEYPYLPLELHGADDELDMSGYHRLLQPNCTK